MARRLEARTHAYLRRAAAPLSILPFKPYDNIWRGSRGSGTGWRIAALNVLSPVVYRLNGDGRAEN